MLLAQGSLAVVLTAFEQIIAIPSISGTAPLWMFPLVGGITLAVTLLSVWLAGRFLDKRPFLDFGFHLDRNWWLDLIFGLALGIVMATFVFLVQLAVGWVTVNGTFQMSLPDRPFGFTFFIFLLLFIFVGIEEELVSRGYQITNAAEGLNTAALGAQKAMILAWLFSSGIIAIFHIANHYCHHTKRPDRLSRRCVWSRSRLGGHVGTWAGSGTDTGLDEMAIRPYCFPPTSC